MPIHNPGKTSVSSQKEIGVCRITTLSVWLTAFMTCETVTSGSFAGCEASQPAKPCIALASLTSKPNLDRANARRFARQCSHDARLLLRTHGDIIITSLQKGFWHGPLLSNGIVLPLGRDLLRHGSGPDGEDGVVGLADRPHDSCGCSAANSYRGWPNPDNRYQRYHRRNDQPQRFSHGFSMSSGGSPPLMVSRGLSVRSRFRTP